MAPHNGTDLLYISKQSIHSPRKKLENRTQEDEKIKVDSFAAEAAKLTIQTNSHMYTETIESAKLTLN